MIGSQAVYKFGPDPIVLVKYFISDYITIKGLYESNLTPRVFNIVTVFPLLQDLSLLKVEILISVTLQLCSKFTTPLLTSF